MAVSYSNLATAVDASRDYNGAVELVDKGLEILKHLQSSSEPSEEFDVATVEYYMAVLQANLGTIHLNNGKIVLHKLRTHCDQLSSQAKGKVVSSNLIGDCGQKTQKKKVVRPWPDQPDYFLCQLLLKR